MTCFSNGSARTTTPTRSTSCLAAAAVEKLDGDPLWLLIVSGPGNAKTETVQPFHSVGGIVVSSISSEAALLSGDSQT